MKNAIYALSRNYHRVVQILAYIIWRLTRATQVKTGRILSGKSFIYYQRSGVGQPVVFLHGGFSQLESFSGQIPFFSKSFQIIALDTRGHGRSTRGANSLSYRTMAEDVVAVLKALNIKRAMFVGWSDGGNACLLLALQYPKIVAAMVLIGVNFLPSGIKDHRVNRSFLFHRATHLLYKLYSPHPEKWQELNQELTRLWQNEPKITKSELASINTPTLIIGGEQDLISQDHLRELCDSMPNAELHLVEGAQHDPHLSNAKELNELIKTFISR